MQRNPAYRILSAQTLEDAAAACLDAAVRIESVLSGAVFFWDEDLRQWMRNGYQVKGSTFIHSSGHYGERDFPLSPGSVEPVTVAAGVLHPSLYPPVHSDGPGPIDLLAFPAVCQDNVAGGIIIAAKKESPLKAAESRELISLSAVLGGSVARLNAETALRRYKSNERMYRAILDVTPHIIGISTIEDGIFIDANDAFTKILEYTKQEVLGKSSKSLGVFADPAKRDEALNIYLRDGELDQFEIQYRTKSGKILDVLLSAKPIDYQGRPCLLTVHTDITALKQAQKELESAKAELETRVHERTRELEQANLTLSEVQKRLQAAYDGMPVPLYILKRKKDDFLLVDFNKAADEESDGRLNSLFGVKASTFYQSQGRSDILEWIEQSYLQKKTIVRDIDYQFHTTGREKALIVSFAYVPPDLILMSSIDITERKRAEEQLVAYQDQLRRLAADLAAAESRERRRIAGDLHDQIGQILFLAKVKLRSLLKIEHPEVTEAANDIGELIGWALRDVRTLIVDISPPILHELGLVEALRDFGEHLQSEHGIKTAVTDDGRPKQLPPDLLDLVFRAVRELSINVLKHARASNLTISLKDENDRLILEVQDDGIGFTPSAAFSPGDGKSGFGLFSLRERLTSIDGRLETISQPGLGSTVIVEIPYL